MNGRKRPSAIDERELPRMHHTPRESGLEERERLYQTIRQLTESRGSAFDQGFAACLAMVKAGATIERLEQASGVVFHEWSDTEPVDMRERAPVPVAIAEADTQPAWIGESGEFALFEITHDTIVD